jgi:transposase
MQNSRIVLAPPERRALKRRSGRRSGRADDAKRARLILGLAGGQTYSEIMNTLACSQNYIVRWKSRFLEQRIGGLYARHQGRKPAQNAAQLEARILNYTRRGPRDGSTHWSTRKLGKMLGISHNRVHRTWRRVGLQPHRLRRYMASDDPQFEKKAADIIGLYLKPPTNAAVFCVDEKSAIQALDRLDPVLPLSPGRAERHGFEYYRHGTLSLYGALETRTGEVVAKTAPRHTSAEFVAFLAQIVAQQPKGRKIHIIADNLSAHKTKGVAEFLAHHRQVKLHYTPTYSSWLNQVELWFSKIQRDLIARGVFTSVPDLSRKLLRYIAHYNKAPKAFKWSWRNPSQRIPPTHASFDTLH